MPTSRCSRLPLARRFAALVVSVCVVAALTSPAAAETRTDGSTEGADGGSVSVTRGWSWPVHPFRLERPFVAPPHRYGPGHRGIDLRPLGDPVVRSPAAGVVAFSGQVAGRGVVTIDHGSGLVTTLEPVDSELVAGTPVPAGAPIGTIATGGHTAPGLVHFGVRIDGEYVNPLVLLGGIPRAVLLPCC